nr:hypothetical protein [Tanacetum cinerariifolium]
MSIEIRKKEKLLQQEQWAYLSTHPSKRLTSFYYDDDDNEDYTSAITPDEPILSTEEPDNSLSMGDEHLDTISATESDEFIKSSVENLISIPRGIDDDILRVKFLNVNHLFSKIEASNDNPILFYDPIISRTPLTLTPSGESDFFLEVDAFLAVEDEPTSSELPKSYIDPEGETNNFDNSLPEFTTFSKVLFDAECESDSNDDQSCSDEDVLEKIVSRPLSEEEIIPMKSLRTHDSSLLVSSKIDSLLYEFVGELTLLKSIPSVIDETDCDFEEDIRLIEKLLYDNSSPRPSEEFVSANSDAKIKYFSPSPILVKDSDSLMEEIDLFCTLDYPMPPSIEDKDYDSERDILICKDLPRNNTLSFNEKESFHFDIPLFSRPNAKPPDGDIGILNIKMMGDIYDQKAFMHKPMITLAPHQEKSPDLLSNRGLKSFLPFAECPMMIHGQNNPILDVLLFHFYPP